MRRRTLRVRLLTVLLSLTLFVVLFVGGSGYLNMRSAGQEFADQSLKQTADRIDHRLDYLVYTAIRQNDLNQHIISSGLAGPNDATRLAAYWHEVLLAYPTISNVYKIGRAH